MSKSNISKKAVQYHISRVFSTKNDLSEQEIQKVFIAYYINKKKIK